MTNLIPICLTLVICWVSDQTLLLICCFMYLPLIVGVLWWSLFWHTLLYALFSFATILTRKWESRAGCFAFIVFWMSCYCKFPVALSHTDVGSSEVCECGLFWSYSLTFVVVDLLFIVASIVCRGSVFGPCFVIQYLVSVQFCNHHDAEERAGCITLTVFLMSCDNQ